VIVPDVNLLIYAINVDAEQHRAARQWLETILAGTRPVGLAWSVLLAFVRVTTLPRVFANPLGTGQALDIVEGWIRHPRVRVLTPTPSHWGILRALLRASGTAGNLSSDAHLAAIAIGHAATLASADNDFRRFAGLDHVNPLAAVAA